MITFGITGGIACGKSTVTKTFRAEGIPIVDADIVARQVVEPGTTGLQSVIDAFGIEYLQTDGTLNRTALGALVFSNEEARHLINKIMYPLINDESTAQIKKLHDAGHVLVGYDAALICEMGNSEKYRPLIVVHCQRDMQIARLMSRNNLTRSEAMARIEAQMPVEKKMELANYLINTSGTIENSINHTKLIIELLKRNAFQT